MSSYHSSFSYNGENSLNDRNLIITSFEPDDGFVETFLSMDVVQEDYYDGTKKYTYGGRYNTTATIEITVIKNDGSDFSLNEVRSHLKWLTGSRVDSWLNLYAGDKFQYAFLGRVTDVQQRKMDARTIGLSITFTSVAPWAFSDEITLDDTIAQRLFCGEDGILIRDEDEVMNIDDDGVLYLGEDPNDENAKFLITGDGTIYPEDVLTAEVINESDDLYSYIYLDIELINESCKYLKINNTTLNEITMVDNIKPNDIIRISNKQFVAAYSVDELTGELSNQNRIFGDDFNFIWPRLAPGVNDFEIEGSGNGTVKFKYRYPMKVGDCAIDTITSGCDINCGNYPDDEGEIFTGTIAWGNITDLPSTIAGYGITDAYTMEEVDEKIEDIEVSGGSGENVNINEADLNNMLSDILGI